MIYYFAIMEGFQLLNAYVIESGTLVQHRAQRPYDDHPHVSRVAHLKKGDLETDVILSASKSPLEPVAVFWATAEHPVSGLHLHLLVDTQLPSRKTLDLIRNPASVSGDVPNVGAVRVWPGILSKGRTGESYSEAEV
ncbi:hypothetical protein LXA43DRAFT_1091432 [Ganoderma leucocontextum]|nr:hypothetical protein LXA43DRAFT_1091432 [Ganoderma leucocontextum]